MQDEYAFATDEVTRNNLDTLSVERSITNERRILELYDVASSLACATLELLRDGLSIYEALSILKEGLSIGESPEDDGVLAENAAALAALSRSLSNLDRAALAGLYADAMRECGSPLAEMDFLPSDRPSETFTYVKNPYSDEAYDVFSQDFASPSVKYSATFKECAQALAVGDVGYCLFPLEEKGGARLHTVAELVYRHDFKINSVTPVFGFDAGADIKYALVSRHFSVPPRVAGDDRYLEIRLSSALPPAISDILCAASVLGMSVYRVNTLTFDTEGEEATFFSLVLRDDGREFTPFLTYLALFAEDAVPVGVYKNLE